MGLFDKVRVLVGALAHKPFAPHRDRAAEDGAEEPGRAGEEGAARSELEQRQPEVEDAERVADLIAQKRRDGGA